MLIERPLIIDKLRYETTLVLLFLLLSTFTKFQCDQKKIVEIQKASLVFYTYLSLSHRFQMYLEIYLIYFIKANTINCDIHALHWMNFIIYQSFFWSNFNIYKKNICINYVFLYCFCWSPLLSDLFTLGNCY